MKYIFRRIIVSMLSTVIFVVLLTGSVMLPVTNVEYINGTADDTSKDAEESDTNTYSIDYDPNEDVISYGVVGTVGAREENDTNNAIYRGTKYKLFPSDY